MTKNREKVIKKIKNGIKTGYLNEKGIFIHHSFDDEPAIICDDGAKFWFKDGLIHRDNNLPARIWSDGNYTFYKNGIEYWFINNKEYHSYKEIKETFKNKILELKNVNINILKENNIDAIWLTWYDYIIFDQTQYNLAILKFL